MRYEDAIDYAMKKLHRSNLSDESREFYELALKEIMFARDYENAKLIGYWEGYKDGIKKVVKSAERLASECGGEADFVKRLGGRYE